jgi:hypothetical protein
MKLYRYDEFQITLYLKSGKNLTEIDRNAIGLAMEKTFLTLVHEFKKRALTSKLKVKISKRTIGENK